MNNKGFLFTIITFLLLFSIMLFAKAYVSQTNSLQESIINGYITSKLGIIENDILSNVFHELLTIQLESINRGASVDVKFNFSELTSSRNYQTIMSNYQTYIENSYTNANNLDATLKGFNNTFVIQPYGTIYEINGQSLYLYFLPPYTNINKITFKAWTDSEITGTCNIPLNDGSGVEFEVTFEDYLGNECTGEVFLSPTENNDAESTQFYTNLINPAGSLEVKFGQVEGDNGVMAVLTSNANLNITEIYINYDLVTEKVYLESGTISIGDNKTSKIILAQE